jgi:outer membrane protein assembly factor BamB
MWRFLLVRGPAFNSLLLSLMLLGISACTTLTGGASELVRAIPDNAAFIVKISHPEKFTEQLAARPYQEQVSGMILPEELMTNHDAFTSFLHKGGYLPEGSNVPLLSSLHLASASRMNSIHYFPLELKTGNFERQLEEHFPGSASQVWNYEGVHFHEVLLPDLGIKLTIAYTAGILIASPAAFLVEDAVKQLKGGKGLLADEGFKKVYRKETDKADANIWMPFANARIWMSLFASEQGLKELSGLEHLASWIMMDVYLNEDEIFLSGILSAETGSRLAGYRGSAACSQLSDEAVPFNTAGFVHRAFMTDTVAAILEENGLGHCWSSILIEPMNTSLEDHYIHLLPVTDEAVFESSGNGDGGPEGVLSRLFFDNATCYTRKISGLLAFSTNRAMLENYVANISGGRNISGESAFLELKGDLRTDAVVTAYSRMLYNRESFRAIFESDDRAREAYNSLKGFSQAAIQLSSQDDIFQANATLKFSEDDGSHTNLAWRSDLDAPVLAGPAVIQLGGPDNYAVIVQDTDFKLYLLDKSGKERWRRQLESRWMGEVHELDLFQGSNPSLAFNTESSWYLVDMDGKDMAGFPLRFKDNASAPMSLDKVGEDYLVFIPSRNGNLYGYELSGKPLQGWNPKEKTGIIRHAPQLVEEGGELYVTAVNEIGMAYIWDRNGNSKTRNAFGTAFPSDHFLDTKADPFKMKNVMQDGELVSMNQRGRVGRYRLQASGIRQFAMADIHGGTDPEILLSSGEAVWLFDYKGQLLWKKTIRGAMTVVDLPGSTKSAIAMHDKTAGTFQLLDAGGQFMLAEPVPASGHNYFTANDFLGSGQPALITSGQENEVLCYRVAFSSN